MNLKLCYLAFFLALNFTIGAQVSHEFIEMDDSRLLSKAVINRDGNVSKVIVFTGEKQSKAIKFSTYLLEFSAEKLISKTRINIDPIEGNKLSEERVCAIRKLSNDNFLLVTMSDKKKKNSLVFRVFDASGKMIKQQLFSNTSDNRFYNLQISNGNFVLCYREYKSESLKYIEFDNDLKVLSSVSKAVLDPKTMQSNGFFIQNGFVYAMYTRITGKDTDFSKPQFSIYKLDLNNGKNNQAYHFTSTKFHCRFQCFVNIGSVDVISYELTQPRTTLGSGTICIINIDLNTLYSTYKKTNIDMIQYGAWRSKGSSKLSRNIDFSFDVSRNIKKEYFVCVRSGIENSSLTRESEGKYVREFNLNLGATCVLVLDSMLETIKSEKYLNNAQSISSYSSHLFMLHDDYWDLSLSLLRNDTSKYFLTYEAHSVDKTLVLSAKLVKSGEYNYDSAISINHKDRKVVVFEQTTIEELSDGVFLMKVYLRGNSDALLVMKAKLED